MPSYSLNLYICFVVLPFHDSPLELHRLMHRVANTRLSNDQVSWLRVNMTVKLSTNLKVTTVNHTGTAVFDCRHKHMSFRGRKLIH